MLRSLSSRACITIVTIAGQLNAPTSETFKKHFFDNGTYVGRYGGQDYFRSDGSVWGVGPKDTPQKKAFDPKEWQR